MNTSKKSYFLLFGLIFLILPLFATFLNLYVDWLFFKETGYSAVLLKTLLSKAGTGVSFGAAFLFFVLANVIIANKADFPQRNYQTFEGVIHLLIFGYIAIDSAVSPESAI